MIAVPLASDHITNAAGLANHIGNVSVLLKWNPETQLFRFFSTSSGGDNFAVSPGEAVFINISSGGPSIASFVGSLTDVSHTLVAGGYNFLSLPLSRSDLTNASSVAADITNVTVILKWNEATSLFRFYSTTSGGDNFTLTPRRFFYNFPRCWWSNKLAIISNESALRHESMSSVISKQTTELIDPLTIQKGYNYDKNAFLENALINRPDNQFLYQFWLTNQWLLLLMLLASLLMTLI